MKKKNLTAMTMAAMMIMANVSPAMLTAMAAEKTASEMTTAGGAEEAADAETKSRHDVEVEGKTQTIDGDVVFSSESDSEEIAAVSASEKASLTINGDVKTTNKDIERFTAVYADQSDVAVSGNVSVQGNGTAVTAIAESTVTVGGDVLVEPESDSTRRDGNAGVNAQDDANVHVKGNLTVGIVRDNKIYGSGDGILADYGSDVTVDGNVTAAGSGVNAMEGSSVTVGGNLQTGGGDAIYVIGSDNKVIVKGDFDVIPLGEEGKKYGLTIYTECLDGKTPGNNNEVAIAGTVKNGDGCLLISVPTDAAGNILNCPEIVVGTIESFDRVEVAESNPESYMLKDAGKEVEQKVLSGIKYIVNTSNIENGSISVTKIDGSKLDRDRANLYDVAKASEEIKVQIVPVSGYSVKSVSGGKATVTKNSDGSYTVLVPAGGGVDISAILEKIGAQTPASTVKRSSGGGSSYSAGSMHAVAVTPGAGRTNQPNTPGSWKQNADNSWSFMDDKGETCRNTWIVSNSRWYYADANGKAVTGWVQINGVWYYFSAAETGANPLCAMLAGTTTPDGYVLDSTGAWVK